MAVPEVIGTPDDRDLILQTYGLEAVRVTASQEVRVGRTDTSSTGETRFHLYAATDPETARTWTMLATENSLQFVSKGADEPSITIFEVPLTEGPQAAMVFAVPVVAGISLDAGTVRTISLVADDTVRANVIAASAEITAPVLQLTGADVAEEFKVETHVEPGTVMVVDSERPATLRPCNHAHDKRVVGVVTGAGGCASGIVLGRDAIQGQSVAIALPGTAVCKADASDHPISPGDLLCTSSNPGRAMRADDASLGAGTIFGKALGHLRAGEGLVLALVMHA